MCAVLLALFFGAQEILSHVLDHFLIVIFLYSNPSIVSTDGRAVTPKA